LKKLSPALHNFVQVFEVDHFLVQAAAESSPDPKKALAVDYRELVARLPRAEGDDFLTRLAEGDPGVGLALRKRLSAFLPREHPQPARPRTTQQLLKRADQLEKAEAKRQAEAARRIHIAEMKALAAREAQAWQQVDTLLETGRKIASVYDEATSLLEKLKQLSEFQDTRDVFQARLRQFAQKYASRPSLIGRWKKRGWI
jgi:ATP-dependent DNA ligase